MAPASSKEFLDIQANYRAYRLTLKLVRDTIITYSHKAIAIANLVKLSLLLIDLKFSLLALFPLSSTWTTLQLESNFSPLRLLTFFLGRSSWLYWTSTCFSFSLTLLFLAPSRNVALNCHLTFTWNSDCIFIISF